MHGRIFYEMQHFAKARLGAEGWTTLLKEAGLGFRSYLATDAYPDEEAVALVMAASRITGLTPRAVTEDFGEFLAPSLMKGYRVLLQPGWTTIDIVENAERVHDKVRNDPKATPPRLEMVRISKDQVNVSYTSARKLCGVGIGFIKGIATHFGDVVKVTESQCMHEGAESCEFQVLREGKAAPAA